jgi:predicted Na+-dependent transporter
MNKFAWLMLLLIGAIFGAVQPWLAGIYGLINVITFGLYYRDKSAAKQRPVAHKRKHLTIFCFDWRLAGSTTWPVSLTP